MDVKELGIYIWSDRKRRSIAIMSVLIVLLMGMILYRLYSIKPPPPPGANRVVICKKCKFVDIRRIVDIKKTKCRCVKCGGPLAIAWKCGACKYEYYVVDAKPDMKKMKNTMDKFKFVLRTRRCPNCGEEKNVGPMSISDYKKNK